MSPPGLPSTKAFQFSVDVAIRFTPRATGQDVYTPQGHIFLANGLVPPMRADSRRSTWTHLSLLFSEHILQIAIMKEMLCVYVESTQAKEKCSSRNFQECADAGAAAGASFMRTSGIR